MKTDSQTAVPSRSSSIAHFLSGLDVGGLIFVVYLLLPASLPGIKMKIEWPDPFTLAWTLPIFFGAVNLGLAWWRPLPFLQSRGVAIALLTQESYALSRYFHSTLGANWPRWGQMLVSLVWSLFGALLLMGGIYRRQQKARLAALGLLCATVVKVFLFDLGFLNGPSRVFSLGGLGLALIFISWLYSRFGTGKMEATFSEAM